ncbi:matrix metalloproteinase-17-like [Tubulanus polymorphus]|uniref:matrix metalloproteinase-17-like n=1 Tax=Tubulanus polymorphus TaxID=672921 RepID=UPI003DA1CDF4
MFKPKVYRYAFTFLINIIITRVIVADSSLSSSEIVHDKTKDEQRTTEKLMVPQNFKAHGLDYLMKYGYLPTKEIEIGGALRSEDDLKFAIRTFQKYANIKQTGQIDQETISMMQASRCGLPDIIGSSGIGHRKRHVGHRRRGKRYSTSGTKWSKKHLTYRIINHSKDLEIEDIQRAFSDAFKIWSDVTPLTFTEITGAGEADIHIRFAKRYHDDGYPFDGPGRVLAHAFFPGDRRGGDTHFDDDETWTISTSAKGMNLVSVAAHEFGHALGLTHSSVVGSMMYPWYQGWSKSIQLGTDDIHGIQSLYGNIKPYDPLNPLPTEIPIDEDGGHNRGIPGDQTTTTTTVTASDPTTEPARDEPTYFNPDSDKPDPCKSSYDAISIIRGELFIFTGKWFSRVDKDFQLMTGYPMRITHFWYGLRADIDGVDAVYERQTDGRIIFFKGNKYWVFESNHAEAGFPPEGRPVTELGLPHNIERVDAAFVWGHNHKTYFMSGDMYWRFNEHQNQMDYDYPRDITMWEGVPVPVSAAFQSWNEETYFFKDREYYKFNDLKMKVFPGYPRPSNPTWLKCPPEKNYRIAPVAGASVHRSQLLCLFPLLIISLLNH